MEKEESSSKNQKHPSVNRTLNRESGSNRGQHDKKPTKTACWNELILQSDQTLVEKKGTQSPVH